ncbi:hypothetical protein ACH4FX_39055 [Streptomyces sp. NPDC018019]|uniref:hypothetical protein n=1 Tax=Streptomyces sp. NPDC018019 TaxID=3365030 RepID=UPI0037BD2A2C
MPQRSPRKTVTVVAEAVALLISGAITFQLAEHDVSVAVIISAACSTLATGLYLANRIEEARSTTFYACPAKSCTVSIRARGASPDELRRLRALATVLPDTQNADDGGVHGADVRRQ